MFTACYGSIKKNGQATLIDYLSNSMLVQAHLNIQNTHKRYSKRSMVQSLSGKATYYRIGSTVNENKMMLLQAQLKTLMLQRTAYQMSYPSI